jgi:hypothetical protein
LEQIKPYSREELRQAADGRWPDRGQKCERCGVLVPLFEELTVATRTRLLSLVVEGTLVRAEEELMAATGAPPRFAKIWIIHQGTPQPRFSGPPCPYCGNPLASSRARQCLHCHRDWHDGSQDLKPTVGTIGRVEMMNPMLAACPSFAPAWKKFLHEWPDTDDKPLYLALGELARHIISMLASGDRAALSRVFEVVEAWHLHGDAYVKEAATIGLLEDLQNPSLHESTSPTQFEQFLLPESLNWWRKVERFWSGGPPIAEE